MSISTQPLPNPSAPPPKGISIATLILSLALAVAVTAAIVLAVLHFRQPGSTGGGPLAAILGEEALVQKDTVSPQNKYTGIVYYPVPYGSPPNLKLTSTKRQYDIVKQDETGFTWIARATLEDFREDKRKDGEGMLSSSIEHLAAFYLKPNIQYEDFTWEAKGVRGGQDAGAMRVFEQTGTFTTVAGKDGEVNFQIPYALAPNVELSGNNRKVVIAECRPTGFKWKNGGTDNFMDSGNVTWTAKGIRAKELPKPN